jgi:ferrous iron transport protein A
MATHIKLTNITKGKIFQISGFTDQSSEYAEKLHKMGFVEGTPIELAPVHLSDPIIFQIRGSRIALRKKEAQEILVKEL